MKYPNNRKDIAGKGRQLLTKLKKYDTMSA